MAEDKFVCTSLNISVFSGPGSLPKPTYKNSESGGYAVSTNSQENTGVLLGKSVALNVSRNSFMSSVDFNVINQLSLV